MTKTNKLQAEIQEKEAQLLELQDKRRQSKEQIDALEAERRGLVVAARVHQSPDAQKAIERLVAKITKAQDEDALNGEASIQISGEIEATKAELRREQWRGRCAAVRQLVEPRVSGDWEQRALKLALDLRDELRAIAQSDNAISAALQNLHPSLVPLGNRVNRMPVGRADIILVQLKPAGLENPFNPTYSERLPKNFQGAGESFREVLQALDALAETEPAAQRA